MANLITEKQKKVVRVDYYTRLFSVFLFVPISLLGIFLLAYIVPYYIAVLKKDVVVAEQFKSVIVVENKENVGESATIIVSQTLEEMKIVDLYNNSNFVPSVYFNKIISNKSSGILINQLTFSGLKDGHLLFIVNGVSKNRQDLVTFIQNLKAKAGFTGVDSPISDFARENNISFTLNINTKI